MSQVGKVEIETVPAGDVQERLVRATVEVGGSLVSVQFLASADPDLSRLVDQLIDQIQAAAVDVVQRAITHPEG